MVDDRSVSAGILARSIRFATAVVQLAIGIWFVKQPDYSALYYLLNLVGVSASMALAVSLMHAAFAPSAIVPANFRLHARV